MKHAALEVRVNHLMGAGRACEWGGWSPTSVGVKYGGGPLCGHYFYEVFCVMGCVNRQGYNPLRVQGAK